MPITDGLYREYMTFFEHAETKRRWNPFRDIPWSEASASPRSERLALAAEMFFAVELFLPDYMEAQLEAWPRSFGPVWFAANWSYEESKHALVLREYLTQTGQRSEEQMVAFEQRVLSQKWQSPFQSARELACYGAIQEMTTFVIYKKNQGLAEAEGDRLLGTIYRTLARDEMAHCRFYITCLKHYLMEDRAAALADLGRIFRNFKMPDAGLVPDAEPRVAASKSAGIDPGVFLTESWLPLLRMLGLDRHDVPRPRMIRPERSTTP